MTRRNAAACLLAVASFAALSPSAGAQQAEAPPVERLEIDPLAGAPVVLKAQQLRGLPGEVAALLLRGNPGGQLPIEINGVPVWQGGDKANLAFVVEIDGAALLERTEGAHGRVEVYVYALDGANRIGDFASQAFTVDGSRLGEALWQSGVRFNGQLALDAGAWRLRVLVRESKTKAASLREMTIEVPPKSGGPSLGPPFLQGPLEREGWIPVRAATPPPAAQVAEVVPELEANLARKAAAHPLLVEERPVLPESLPVLVAERPAKAHLLARGLGAGAPPVLMAEIRPSGKQGAPTPLTVGAVERWPTAGGDMLRFELRAPPVPPGRYLLAVRTGQLTSPAREILVLSKDTREREMLWTDLRFRLDDAGAPVTASAIKTATATNVRPPTAGSPAAPAATQAAAEPEPEVDAKTRAGREAMKARAKAIAEDYRMLLAELPAYSAPTNVARLLELEGRIAAEDRLNVVALLQNAELDIAGQLAKWDAEALVPLIHLHFESYLAYRQRQSFALLTHSRLLVDRLIEMYVDRSKGSAGAKKLAALAQSGLAMEADEGNMGASSQRLYRRALELDPASRPALLGLAASEHRQNHGNEALNALQVLVDRYPDLAEAHLRLAVLWRRHGDLGNARAALKEAATLKGPPWVATLVRQEQLQLEIEAGELEQAAKRVAANRPAELGEVALAAYLADRRGRLQTSLDLASGLKGSQPESARLRFDRVPPDEQEAIRGGLAGAASSRQQMVAEWAGKGKR
jgi:hypothetical protein